MPPATRAAADVAHDLNNALTLLLGFTDLLLTRIPADAEARTYAQEIRKAGDDAAELTRQLMALGRRQPDESAVSLLSAPAAELPTRRGS